MHRPRSRDIAFDVGVLPSGPLDAITDVAGVRVGSVTLISGAAPLIVNALLAAETMVGRHGITGHALTGERRLEAVERVRRG